MPKPMEEQNVWFVDIPFDMRGTVPNVRWDSDYKHMVYRGERLPTHLEPFRVQVLSWSWHQQYHVNGRHLEPLTKLTPEFLPRPHQQLGIKTIQNAYKSKSPGFVLADEVGVGKTMSAWGFALATPALKTVLIVTTASAQAHWRNTVRHAGWLPTHSVVIINYDRLDKMFEIPEQGLTSTKRKGKRKRVAKQGSAIPFDLVIFDESHKGKNPTSARGLMMRKIEKKAKFCIYASATAGQNPLELIYLSSVLSFASGKNVPVTMDDYFAWCQQQNLGVSKGNYGKIEWNHDEADLEKIQQWIFAHSPPLGIRRLPQDIAGWPELSRQMYTMSLDGPALSLYATAWEEFVKARKLDVGRQNIANVERNRQRLRQQSSWIKIPYTIDVIKELLENNKKVAVSVAYQDTLQEMLEQLKQLKIEAVGIHGKLSATEKENNRLNFQKGSAKVVVFTVEEAISLHQGEYGHDPYARVLLIHDVRWSAIQMAQIEGRCHRDGQNAPVWWMVIPETVDIGIAEVMVQRIKGMKALHGDPMGDMAAIEEVLRKYS